MNYIYMSSDTQFAENAVEFIYSHKLKDTIIANYIRGPPSSTGFTFYNWKNDNSLSPESKEAFDIMEAYVLCGGYDSGASYGGMQREIQNLILLSTPVG